MIVKDAKLQFSSAHALKEEFKQTESLIAQRPNNPDGSPGERRVLQSDSVTLSREERALRQSQFATPNNAELRRRGVEVADAFNADNNGAPRPTAPATDLDQRISSLDAKTQQLKVLVESFTGKAINLEAIETKPGSNTDSSTAAPPAAGEGQPPPESRADLIYQYTESYSEFESSLFVASGSVTLESGQTIDVDFSQYAERNFSIENSLEMKVGEVELTDPLVINLRGPGLSLSDEKYRFDLDNDGEAENINFATQNSGFLALDRNQNGAIDDGSELFGALTGNGFAELAQYDEDGNGFIDSGDSVFSQLQFYQKDSEGQDQLKKLGDLGIGAFYLGSESTPFQVKDSDNALKAVVRSSGIFLNEDGSVGGLQQIDLVV